MININHYFADNSKHIKASLHHNWQSSLITKSGTPDKKLIVLIQTIIYWYKPQMKIDPVTGKKTFIKKFNEDAWQTSYSFLAKALNCSKDTVRKKLVKAEQLGILKRELRDIIIRGQTYNDRLFIHIKNDFFKKATGFDKISYKGKEDIFEQKNAKLPPQKKTSLYIDINNINKNRSIKSNFYEIDLVDLENKNTEAKKQNGNDKEDDNNENNNSKNNDGANGSNGSQKNQRSEKGKVKTSYGKEIKKIKQYEKRLLELKKLEDFYPLSKEEVAELQVRSGREFSLNAMNEILKKLINDGRNLWFRFKAGFMSYMTKVFMYEKRDAVKTNSESFKIRANYADEVKRTDETDEGMKGEIRQQQEETREQEAYLTKIEYSLEVSSELHFKKKIAATLERKKAYDFLKAYKRVEVVGNIMQIHLANMVTLGDQDHDIILNQAKATHQKINIEEYLNKHLEMDVAARTSGAEKGKEAKQIIEQKGEITRIEIITARPELQGSQADTDKIILISKSSGDKEITHLKAVESTGIWSRIRKSLVANFNNKKEGEAIDRNWFSKLEAEIDEDKKIIKLKAPTSFIKSYIQTHYGYLLERITKDNAHTYVL